jgi:[ribosomal protein S18]-alanine N-acetyltransferase
MSDPGLRGIVLTLARSTDAIVIAGMSRNLIETGLGWSWTPVRVGNAIDDPDTVVLTARAGEEVIGFAIMEFGDDTSHLSLLAVKPSRQRKGIGRKLFQWLKESALTAGIAVIKVEMRATNTDAKNFYHSLGFVESGITSGYYRRREDALRMALRLRPRSRDSSIDPE